MQVPPPNSEKPRRPHNRVTRQHVQRDGERLRRGLPPKLDFSLDLLLLRRYRVPIPDLPHRLLHKPHLLDDEDGLRRVAVEEGGVAEHPRGQRHQIFRGGSAEQKDGPHAAGRGGDLA